MTNMCGRISDEVRELDVPFAVFVGKKDPTLHARLVRNNMVRSKTPRSKQSFLELDTFGYPLMSEEIHDVLNFFTEEMRKM